MALRCPFAIWDPLGAQTQPRMRGHDIICLHTMDGTFSGTNDGFHRNGYGGVESHFGLAGDGRLHQWQDLGFEADANVEGDWHLISVETADRGESFAHWTGSDVPAWTQPQLDRLLQLVTWLCSREAHSDCPSDWTCHSEGIPRQLIPDTRPERRGIGYHRQGIGAAIVPGGEDWSLVEAKACPGNRRIEQIQTIIIPGGPGPDPDGDQQEDDQMLIITAANKPAGLLSGGRVVRFADQGTLQQLIRAGIKVVELDVADYNRFLRGFGDSID